MTVFSISDFPTFEKFSTAMTKIGFKAYNDFIRNKSFPTDDGRHESLLDSSFDEDDLSQCVYLGLGDSYRKLKSKNLTLSQIYWDVYHRLYVEMANSYFVHIPTNKYLDKAQEFVRASSEEVDSDRYDLYRTKDTDEADFKMDLDLFLKNLSGDDRSFMIMKIRGLTNQQIQELWGVSRSAISHRVSNLKAGYLDWIDDEDHTKLRDVTIANRRRKRARHAAQ